VPKTQLAKLRSTQTVPTASRIDLPRPAIVAALGVLVLAITFLVTKAGDDTGSVAVPANTPATSTTATGTSTTTNTGTTSTPAKTAKPKQPAVTAGAGLPSDVARALNANKVVVLFFYDPAASDDQATRAAIRAARGAGRGVSLFQDTVARISDYRRVVGALGISQSPAMVVIDRNRKAELLQGYLDSGTIRQTVRDAL
jgi:sugar/nucleoside kinase (ribokinase family)